MTGSGEDSDAAQDQQGHCSSDAPVQTIACEVTAHEQTPNAARKVIYHHGDSSIVEITPGTARALG
jgi:hypothetical protein